MRIFEKSTLKRSAWEKKHKKLKDEDLFYKEMDAEKRQEKLSEIKARQDENERKRMKAQENFEKKAVGNRSMS